MSDALNTPCSKCGELQHWVQRKDRSFGYKCLRCEGNKIMGLNIIEAVKSGKRYRIKGSKYWCEPGDEGVTFNAEGVLADWEIEEKKIEITENEFDAIVAVTIREGEDVNGLKKRLFGKETE